MDRNKAYLRAARTPALTLLALLVLLGVNILFAWLPLGGVRGYLNVAICALMALGLMTFCMHLRGSDALLRMAAATGFAWLCILIAITMVDYVARTPVPSPW